MESLPSFFLKRKSLLITLLLLFAATLLQAQKQPKFFAKEWRCYRADSSSYDYIHLKSNGTGTFGVGLTINGEDVLDDAIPGGIEITHWEIRGNQLIIQDEFLTVIGKATEYEIISKGKHKFVAKGNSIGGPIYLNEEKAPALTTFTFTEAGYLTRFKERKSPPCIYKMKLFSVSAEPVDASFLHLNFLGLDQLGAHISACGIPSYIPAAYKSSPFTMKLPRDFETGKQGMLFGEDDFSFSFHPVDTLDDTSIYISYDPNSNRRNRFFSDLESGEEERIVEVHNGHEVFLFKNWQDKHSGKIFFGENVIVCYYTHNTDRLGELKECISSFRFTDD